MRLRFTPEAERDLEEIADFIAQDNPRRALSFIGELRKHCGEIASAPLSCRARPELDAGLRSSAHGKHVIFVKLVAEEVLIVRILHGARDLPTLFSETDSDEPGGSRA